MNKNNDYLHKALCEAVEQRAGMKMCLSADFDWLAAQIQEHVHQMVSANTLKRLWGYYENVHITTSKSVLNLLAQYLGYRDYAVFVQATQIENINKVSGNVRTRHLETKKLDIGTMLSITWNPDRRLIVEHLGKGRFIVREVENSKLSVGDTFECHLLIEGETLFLGNLSHEGAPPLAYQAGRQGGIHFNVLMD